MPRTSSSSNYTFRRPSSVSASSSRRPSSSSTSYYKRRPRDGYIRRIYEKIKEVILDAVAYARKHPMKVLFPLVMALVSGGAIGAILKNLGLSVPDGVEQWMGTGRNAARGARTGYDAFYGSQEVDTGSGGGFNWGSAVKVASAFL